MNLKKAIHSFPLANDSDQPASITYFDYYPYSCYIYTAYQQSIIMAFIVKETRTTPFIKVDMGEIIIKGRSIPEDALEFYEPVLDACRDYVEKPATHTLIDIHLDYVNSGSKKYLTNVLTVLEKSYLEGNSYEVNWTYDIDDEAMLDLGHDLKGIIKIPLSINQSE